MKTTLEFSTDFVVQDLSMDRLYVDTLYQRPLDIRRAKRIAEDYLEISENLPVINIRDGKMFIVDGQHTIEARRILGETMVKCKVLVDSLSIKHEAFLFFLLNKEQKEHTEKAKIRVRYRFGDPYIMAMNEIVKKHEFVVDWDLEGKQDGKKIFAIVKLYKIYDDRGPKVLDITLDILRQCYADSKLVVSYQFLGGTSLFVSKYPTYIKEEYEELLSILKLISPEDLFKKANDLRLKYSNSTRVTTDDFLAMAILDFVNRGRYRKRHLPNLFID